MVLLAHVVYSIHSLLSAGSAVMTVWLANTLSRKECLSLVYMRLSARCPLSKHHIAAEVYGTLHASKGSRSKVPWSTFMVCLPLVSTIT
jgi:hypothetical protein